VRCYFVITKWKIIIYAQHPSRHQVSSVSWGLTSNVAQQLIWHMSLHSFLEWGPCDMLSALWIAIAVDNWRKSPSSEQATSKYLLRVRYSLYPSSSLLVPHIRSLTYSDCDMWWTKVGRTETNFSRCCRRLECSRNGQDNTPNTTLVNCKATTLWSFSTKLSIYRRNRQGQFYKLGRKLNLSVWLLA